MTRRANSIGPVMIGRLHERVRCVLASGAGFIDLFANQVMYRSVIRRVPTPACRARLSVQQIMYPRHCIQNPQITAVCTLASIASVSCGLAPTGQTELIFSDRINRRSARSA
jgi:hypothetical protein